nr:MAG TPA: hypothetical protein [Caudoviricetes sp.]
MRFMDNYFLLTQFTGCVTYVQCLFDKDCFLNGNVLHT